jgi:hypothetical protein
LLLLGSNIEAASQLYNVFKHAKLYELVDTETTKIVYARNLVPNVQKWHHSYRMFVSLVAY